MSNHPHNKHQRLGGKLGPRIADTASRAMSDHLQRTADYRSRVSAEAALKFFETITREKLQHVTPFTRLYLGHADTPPEVEKLLQFISHGQGEGSELLNMLGVGQAVGTSIGAGLANFLAPVNQHLIATSPNSLLGADTAAAADRAGVMSHAWAASEAAKQGLDSARFTVLQQMAEVFPGINEVLELLRRGNIDFAGAESILKRQRIAPHWIPYILALKRVHLPPADAALMALRGIIGETEGREIASNAGFTHEDFDKLVAVTGEPPGLMQLLEAYRRGFIDKPRLDKGIKQSRVRNEWIDVVERLRFVPASPADALRGVVQGHLSVAEGKKIAMWGGLRPEDWDWMEQTEGNPPGPMEMLHLMNRGLMSEAQVKQGLRESRLKNKYIPSIIHLRTRLPEGRQITAMLGRGAISHARATQLLREVGYEPDIATALVHSATSDQVAREKALASGTISELYHDHAITRDAALKALESLGYHRANAELLLRVTDLRREHALQTAAISPIRSSYVAHHITQATASTDLDRLGIPASQRDHLLRLWTVDRAAHRRTLTEAQVIKANVAGLFTDEVTIQRLEAMGYTNEDSRILIDLEKGRTKPV